MIKGVSHIGIAAKNLEEVMDFYHKVFQVRPHPPIETGDMRVSMVPLGNAQIELMAPKGEKGVIADFLQKRGEGVQHICFEVDNIEAELELLKAKGVKLIDEKPREGVEGKVAFLHPKSTYGVLVELCEPKC